MTYNEVKQQFEKQYADLVNKGLKLYFAMPLKKEGDTIRKSVPDDTEITPATHSLAYKRPFIFDIRKLPKTFMDYELMGAINQESLPEEFRADEYELMTSAECWSEAHILQYAEEHALEICEQLGDYSFTLKNICDMMVGDFEKHKEQLAKEQIYWLTHDDEEDFEEDEDDDDEEFR